MIVYDLHSPSGAYHGPASDLDVVAFMWWCEGGRRGYLLRGGKILIVKEREVKL